MSNCPCGSGLPLSQCCGPYLDGIKVAPTAEALMRARYTAHVLRNSSFVDDSVHPSRRHEQTGGGEIDDVSWSGLNIVRVEGGGPDDAAGRVEFEARFRIKGVDSHLHEISQFVQEDGVWYYVDGELKEDKQQPQTRTKTGRNEPCPCGSGKKYKKCCGQ